MPTTPLRPMSLTAELTYRCPLKCPYCSNPIELAKYNNELDTETWKRVIREAAALGVIQIHFSGGEPLLRKDILDLIREARRCDMYCDLSTSAATFTESKFQELYDAGLDAIQISLLGARKEESDHFAGTPSFEKKCAAVQAAKRIGFPITLNVVLHRQNLDQLEEVLALAAEWNVVRVELAHVQYLGWAFKNRAALLPTREQLDSAKRTVEAFEKTHRGGTQILHVLPDYYQDLPKSCLEGWGNRFMSVGPDGAVLPCLASREITGLEFPNVADASLEEIWFNAPVFNRFRGTDWMPEPCQSCDRRDVDFGGCRCQAFLMTGDAAVPDPVCHLSPDRHLVDEALLEAAQDPPAFMYRTMKHLV